MADKVAYSDPSLQILSLLGNLGGTTQSGTTTTSSSPQSVAALNQILAQQMQQITPEGMNAIINSIFQQGMRQVPKLGMQYAQAAGARTNKNSPLAYASENLQRQLTEAAAAALLTAQNNAANTASRAADATRTTSTTQTAKPRSSALMALPFLLGQAGNIKKGVSGITDLFSPEAVGNGFGSVPGGSGVDGFIGNNPSAYVAPEMSAGIDPSMFAGSDLMFDAGSLLSNDFSPLTDVVSNAGAFDFSGLEGFDLGAFFADGGLVSRKAPGYADGGQVRGMNTLDSTDSIDLNSFITVGGTDSSGDFGGNNAVPANPTMDANALGEDVLSYFSGYLNQPVSGSGYDPGIGTYTGKNGNTYSLMRSSATQSHAAEGEAGIGQENTARPDLIREMVPGYEDASTYYQNRPLDRVFGTDGTYKGAVANRPDASDAGLLISGILAAIGMATGNPALAFAKTVGTKSAANAIGNFADGGELEGPGTGTSDSIPIMASDGEYIIPKDTVDAFGVEFFDMLKDATHAPTSMQRFHIPGTPRSQQR